MAQTRTSGAAGNKWGRDTAKRIAKALGTQMFSSNSNECMLGHRWGVIKCAGAKTSSVGVPYIMLERILVIVAAFQIDENDPDCFVLYEITPAKFRKFMTPTRSTGGSKGKVGIVTRKIIEKHGSKMCEIKLPPQATTTKRQAAGGGR